jgi:acyl-CoA reductase-like NAD-dependent aldehyde dehydrogenase
MDWISRAESLKPLRIRNLIDGRWLEVGGAPLDKVSPRDGTVLSRFGAGEASEVDAAVASARRAFADGRWSKLPQQRRKDVLLELARLIEAHLEELALLECLDVGKPISDPLTFDVRAAAAHIRHAAETADHVYGKVYGADASSLSYELRRPLGVVAGIIGWNFPLVLAGQKIGPALATGNSLVLKPSELTSFSAARVAELALEAGVPEGVFNVIHGSGGVGSALALHRDVDLVTFTGSSATGKKVMIAAGQSNMKRLVLECGGKAPSIVFEDAPGLDAVADRVVARAFWNQGQVCTASSRLLVQDSIKDELMRLVIGKVSALSPGDPLKQGTRFGAIVNGEQQKKILGYVGQGEQDGARMLYRSTAPAPFANGFYVAPTIFDNVTPTHRIAQEEIFGPILSVLSFRDEDEALRIANSTMYGLSAIVWTKDLGRAHRMTQGIRAGWITVNATETPTGRPSTLEIGGHKQSGLGVEGGIEGLKCYTGQTSVQWFV